DVEATARYAQSARLVERTLRAVRLSGLARPGEGLDGARARVEHFDLVVVRVCDEELVLVEREAERVLKAHIVARAVAVAEVEEVAARERPNLFAGRRERRRLQLRVRLRLCAVRLRVAARLGVERDGADRIRLCVGDVER